MRSIFGRWMFFERISSAHNSPVLVLVPDPVRLALCRIHQDTSISSKKIKSTKWVKRKRFCDRNLKGVPKAAYLPVVVFTVRGSSWTHLNSVICLIQGGFSCILQLLFVLSAFCSSVCYAFVLSTQKWILLTVVWTSGQATFAGMMDADKCKCCWVKKGFVKCVTALNFFTSFFYR